MAVTASLIEGFGMGRGNSRGWGKGHKQRWRRLLTGVNITAVIHMSATGNVLLHLLSVLHAARS